MRSFRLESLHMVCQGAFVEKHILHECCSNWNLGRRRKVTNDHPKQQHE